jgi:hypothetical protein
MKEHISLDEAGEWQCLCGNTPAKEGFYPIDEANRQVQPNGDAWTTDQYYCDRCGRVIDQETLVVARRLEPTAIVRVA